MSNNHFVTRQKCPACGSATFRTIYERPYDAAPLKDYLNDFYLPQGTVEFEYLAGAAYILCACAACGLIFQRDIPGQALMERLYGRWIDPEKAFSQRDDSLDNYASCAREIMRVLSLFRRPPSSLVVLDFGMGWGRWALMAKAFGCDSYGCELSRERIEYAEANGIKIISLRADVVNTFDFINAEQVFEHLAEPADAMHRLARALKPGGVLKVGVPVVHDLERRLRVMDWKARKGQRNSLNPVAPLEHINYFPRRVLIKMAEQAGLKETFIPLRTQYRYSTDWHGFKGIARNLLNPIMKRQDYRLFCKG